jgi:ElaB/YqjD/DUF883 family membrane-anchored ribosome-binding protein
VIVEKTTMPTDTVADAAVNEAASAEEAAAAKAADAISAATERGKQTLEEALVHAERTISEAVKAAERALRDGIEKILEQSKPLADNAGQQFDEAQRYVTERVKERPMTAVLAGVGVGLVLGLLLSNRSQ